MLSDGKPHTHLELYALGTVAHSRVSDLRKKGHAIEQWRDGDLYLYRLLSPAPVSGDRPPSGIGADESKASLIEPSSPSPPKVMVAEDGSMSEVVARPGHGAEPDVHRGSPSEPEAVSLTLFDQPHRPAWA
jgi:hypothetical protein